MGKTITRVQVRSANPTWAETMASIHFKKGVTNFNDQLYPDAIKNFSNAIEKKAAFYDSTEILAKAYFYRARCHYKLHDYLSAVDDFKQAIQLDNLPATYPAIQELVACYEELNQYNKSLPWLEKLCNKTEKTDDNYSNNLYKLASHYLYSNDYLNAAITCESIIENQPEYYNAYLTLMTCQLKQARIYIKKGEHAEATTILNAALECAKELEGNVPTYVKIFTLHYLAHIYKAQGKHDKANAYLTKLTDTDQENYTDLDESSIKVVRKIIAIAQFEYAKVLVKSDNPQAANHYFTMAMESLLKYYAKQSVTPNNSQVFYFMAYAHQFGLGTNQDVSQAKKIYSMLKNFPATDKLLLAKVNKRLQQLTNVVIETVNPVKRVDETTALLKQPGPNSIFAVQPKPLEETKNKESKKVKESKKLCCRIS